MAQKSSSIPSPALKGTFAFKRCWATTLSSATPRAPARCSRDRDRAPRPRPAEAWQIAERICGVCTLVHAMASCGRRKTPEDPDPQERQHHPQPDDRHAVRPRPHRALLPPAPLDGWISWPPSRGSKATSELARRSRDGPNRPSDTSRTSEPLEGLRRLGQLGIFANATGHPAYKLPPEANLLATAHYIEALGWQKEIVKIHAVFGGKNPHPNCWWRHALLGQSERPGAITSIR